MSGDGDEGDARERERGHGLGHGLVHRDNTFGTPEEDAFRRDFTINALFYDAESKSVIDYVGGLGDLEHRTLRSIGDPRVRFVEDPVRMFRAAVLGARLGFDLDVAVVEAIAELRELVDRASPARMLEEYFKVLRSGYAEASFRALHRTRLLEVITPELASPPDALWDALADLDRYRRQFPASPAALTNAVLIGTLLHPIGALGASGGPDADVDVGNADVAGAGPDGEGERGRDRGRRGGADDSDRVRFGRLPVARKDVERLRHVLTTVPRLTDPMLPPRVARGLPHRPSFADAVTWLEVFGHDPAAVEPWKALLAEQPPSAPGAGGRKRRRRRRGRGQGQGHVQAHRQGHGQGHGPGQPQTPPGTPQSPQAPGDRRPRRRRRRR